MNINVDEMELLDCLGSAVDLVNPVIKGHGERVAAWAVAIASELKISQERKRDLYISAILHDVGAASLDIRSKRELEQFDVEDTDLHCITGYLLLKQYSPFKKIAKIVKHHHIRWENGRNSKFLDEIVPLESFILHLADRIDILFLGSSNILLQRQKVVETIKSYTGDVFHPDVYEAFRKIATSEAFWLEGLSNQSDENVEKLMGKNKIAKKGIIEFIKMVMTIVDFKSTFTATHSSGVAAVTAKLARLLELDSEKCGRLLVAGYLHDVGKLFVPNEVLEKPGPLTSDEMAHIYCHAFYTHKVLQKIPEFSDIEGFASQHHEKIDGTGYPFHLGDKNLSSGARILASADVFTALTEDRPYRSGMDENETKEIVSRMTKAAHLDDHITEVIMDNFEELDNVRKISQEKSKITFKQFREDIGTLQSDFDLASNS
jgi:HD-GYP domain-containing protein (c-di-GMP phosphodiesterase class II)